MIYSRHLGTALLCAALLGEDASAAPDAKDGGAKMLRPRTPAKRRLGGGKRCDTREMCKKAALKAGYKASEFYGDIE